VWYRGQSVLSSVICRIVLAERLLAALRLLSVVRSFSSKTLQPLQKLHKKLK
jgi:hypothetical protein